VYIPVFNRNSKNVLHGSRPFITAFTTAYHWILKWASWIQCKVTQFPHDSDSWPLKMVSSVENYLSSLHNIPEESSSHLLHGTCSKNPRGFTSAHTGHVSRLYCEPSTVTKQSNPLSFSIQITHCVLHATKILSSWLVGHAAPQHTISSNLHSLPHSLHPTYICPASAVCSHSVRIHTCPLICDTKFQTHAGHTKLHFFLL